MPGPAPPRARAPGAQHCPELSLAVAEDSGVFHWTLTVSTSLPCFLMTLLFSRAHMHMHMGSVRVPIILSSYVEKPQGWIILIHIP